MVFDHNWGGGGGQPEPYTYCKTPLFFDNIIYIFKYTQFVVVPKKKVTFTHLKHLLS